MRSVLYKITPETLIFIFAVVILAILPLSGMPPAWTLYVFHFLISLTLANMWNLIAGYSGLISLAQPAFIGLAGYTLAMGTFISVPWWLGLTGGAILAGIFALILAFGVFRMSGIYFAIGTLVVPEILRNLAYIWRPVGGALAGGGSGYTMQNVNTITTQDVYWLALVAAIISFIVFRLILSSRLGLGLAAIRDNQRAAASNGVNTFAVKMVPFVVGAVITGLAGAIYYLNQGYISPTKSFSISWTMDILLATVIGGLRTKEGPIIGSAVFIFLFFLLANYGGYSLLIEGLILVVIMMLSPQGLVGLARKSSLYNTIGYYLSKPMFFKSHIKIKTEKV
jgi:branched-chain amino acid transport system permease protein